MSKIHASTQFINIMVKVRPSDKPGEYKVHTAPEVPWVTQPDTIINYQIYDDGHFGIVFTGMSVIPEDNGQLSPASLSISQKQLTFSDANTENVTLNVTLNFEDGHGVKFTHDPQVVNEPKQ